MSKQRYSRQSFLGKASPDIIATTKVAVVGLGGGGSHIVQQLAHIGFLNFTLFDPQTIDESNLNRLIGGVEADISKNTLKTVIARKIILGLQPKAEVETINGRWQDSPSLLRRCDIIFGCVDTFKERSELEICARRYFIPYIDIGMDVFKAKGQPPRMAGQIILSFPGQLCMRCLGFLSEEKLAIEARKYGATGGRPQVVWPNGVLASTSVGFAIDMLTGWSKTERNYIYLSYDGNACTVTPHVNTEYELPEECTHYPIANAGDPKFVNFRPIQFMNQTYGQIPLKKLRFKERPYSRI